MRAIPGQMARLSDADPVASTIPPLNAVLAMAARTTARPATRWLSVSPERLSSASDRVIASTSTSPVTNADR